MSKPNERSRFQIRKGDPVEFSDGYHQHYEMGGKFARYGIATEPERPDGSVEVELADGSKTVARYIHAYAWGGWLPEELEPVHDRYNTDPRDLWDDGGEWDEAPSLDVPWRNEFPTD